MRNTMIVILLMVSPGTFVNAQVPAPVPNWPHSFETEGGSIDAGIRFGHNYFIPHLYNNTINGDIFDLFLDNSFPSGWPVVHDSLRFRQTPIVVDIDHDGRNEIVTIGDRIASGYLYSLVYIIDDDGMTMPGWPKSLQRPSLNVADMDNDHEYEIICYSSLDDSIFSFDRFGGLKPGWPISFHLPGVEQGYKPRQGIIGDLDADGVNEFILAGAWDVFAFKFDGTPQPGFHINLADTAYLFYNAWQPPALADLDLDGYPEIITSGNNWSVFNPIDFTSFVAVYDHNGVMETGWPLNLYRKMITNAIVPSDIDGNGIPEIGIKAGGDQVSLLTFVGIDGDTLEGWPSAAPLWPNDDLITVDINGDGYCEIFSDYNVDHIDSMGHHGWLYGLDYLGQSLPGYPIRTRGSFIGLPPTFTLDRNTRRLYLGLVDHFSFTSFGDTVNLELFLYPDSTGPTTEWPMKSHDNLLTRNYDFVDMVTSIDDDGNLPLPKSPVLRQNYPNPFNQSTMIEFVLQKAGDVRLEVFDILGRAVFQLEVEAMPAGRYLKRIDMSEYASGVYYCSLRTANVQITRKMVLLK